MNINLYLGAHKTATTHLQGILIANRDILKEKRMGLFVPSDLRKNWLKNFFHFQNVNDENKKSALIEDLQSILYGVDNLILSDENIVGVSNDLSIHSGIYPFIDKRLAAIKKIFPDSKLRLFFSIRGYEGFYRSSYSEVVRNRGYIPFERFYKEIDLKTNSWIETIGRCQESIPQADIFLWRFEEFRQVMPTILRLLTEVDAVDAMIDGYTIEKTRPSLSMKTLDLLSDLGQVFSRKELLAMTERINKIYSIDSGYPEYKPFSNEMCAYFFNKYNVEAILIKKKYPNINYIGF